MLGFLGGISRKVALGVAGTVLASGGAVSLAHSTPEILRGIGVVCDRLEVTTVEDQRLPRGRQFIRDRSKNSFFDVTDQARRQSSDGKCWSL